MTLPKARRVITEILLLLKYQKQTITAVAMGKMWWCCYYLLPLEDREYTKSCPILSVRTLHRLGIKFLIGDFAGMSIMNFITESEIVNQPGLADKFIRKLMSNINFLTNLPGNVITQRWKLFRKKFSPKDFFSNELKSSEKKESLQGDGCETKFSYQRLPWISCRVTKI